MKDGAYITFTDLMENVFFALVWWQVSFPQILLQSLNWWANSISSDRLLVTKLPIENVVDWKYLIKYCMYTPKTDLVTLVKYFYLVT